MAKSKRIGQNDLAPGAVEKIRADIAEWKAGLWAEQNNIAPACLCGLGERYTAGNRGYARHGIPTGECYRHADGHVREADSGPPAPGR